MEKKLEDICVFIRNGANIKNDKQKKGIPITRIETISDGKVNEEKMGYADINDDKYKEYYLVKDDILMSHINSLKHLGKVAIFNGTNKIIHGMNLLNIRFSNEVYPPYYYYYFKTINFKNKLKKISKQSVNQSSFSVNDLKKITVNFIEKDKQIKIVNTLDRIQKLIDKNQEQIDLLDELIKSQFVKMFGNPLLNEKKWEQEKLGELCMLKAGKAIKADELSNYKNNKNYPCFGGNGIRGYINKFSHEGNIPLIGRQGALCGNVNYAQGKFYATEHAVTVIPVKSEEFNPYWLYYTLKMMDLNRLAIGVAQPGLTVGKLNQEKIIIVEKSLQDKFSKTVEQIDKQKFNYQRNLQKAQELINTLMNQYFN